MVNKFSLKFKPPKRASSNDKLFADVSIEAFSIFVHPILSAIAFFEEIKIKKSATAKKAHTKDG